jgi:hypothetical protein
MVLSLERCPTDPKPIKDSAEHQARRAARAAEDRAWLGVEA